ncbi:unnamed protein product, partial [Tetraodon nigroviridis]
EDLVPESQSQRAEADQEEAGPVRRQRRFGAQRPGLGQPSARARLAQPHGRARSPVPPPGHEPPPIHQEYTASDCGPREAGSPLDHQNLTEHSDSDGTRTDPDPRSEAQSC